MPLSEGLSVVNEGGGMEEDEGVSDWPHVMACGTLGVRARWPRA